MSSPEAERGEGWRVMGASRLRFPAVAAAAGPEMGDDADDIVCVVVG